MREVWKSKLSRAGIVALLTLGLAATTAQAAVPTTALVEGSLAAASGGAVTDGEYAVMFLLYKTAVDAGPLWQEGANVQVTGGQFSHLLGSTTPLDAATLAQAGYFAIKVGTDPDLPRTPLASAPFAVWTASAAGLDCSGCLPLTMLVPEEVAAYAKAADLANAATTGKLADLAGAPDFSVFAVAATLAKVASTGAYADLSGTPDLSPFASASALADLAPAADLAAMAKSADLSKAAVTGAYEDLADEPALPELGKSCGTGLVVEAINDDGTLSCVEGAGTELLPSDLSVVSNNLLTNIFTDKFSSSAAVNIPDNNPTGGSSTIAVADVGIAQKLTVTIKVTNSDISTVTIKLYDPANAEFVLHKTSGSGDNVDTTYPAPTKTVSGDLTSWHGKNPKGNWRLLVIDGKFLNNTTDGQIVSWSVNLTTLSSKKINVKGELIVDGTLTLGAGGLVPVGLVMPFNAASCPTGWSAADGANNLPDLRGRMAIGVGSLPQGGSVTLRQTGGSHKWHIYGGGTSWGRGWRAWYWGWWGNQDLINHGIGWQGEANAEAVIGKSQSWSGWYDHLPPYTGLLYCVKN